LYSYVLLQRVPFALVVKIQNEEKL